MLKKNAIKGALGLAAALFAVVNVQAQTPGPATQTAVNAAPVKLARSDQKIIKDLAMLSMAELEAARLAQTKSQNEQIKKFA